MQRLSTQASPATPYPAAPQAAFADTEAADVRRALAQLIASEQFAKAQRMSRLITFLIETELSGGVFHLNEYAVGIDVFDRDPGTYSTCDDPIVRVQMGRLRERLAAYYLVAGAAAAIRFSVPLRSYRPIITRTGQGRGGFSGPKRIAIVPLVNCGVDEASLSFTKGLHEEFSFQLTLAFPRQVVPRPLAAQSTAKGEGVTHVLEGSVRTDATLTRICLRLIDILAGCICWSGQFDHKGGVDIDAQEQLAGRMCCTLKHYFDPGEEQNC